MAEKDETAQTDGRTWAAYLQNLALNALVAILRLIPPQPRLRLVGWLARKVLAPRLGWYSRIAANLDHVWPDLPAPRKRAIAEASVDNLARALIENYDPADMLARGARHSLSGPGLPALEAAHRDGRPVILLSGHYGSPICARCAMVARGFPVGGLLRAMSNPYANARYIRNYRKIGEPVFVQGRRGTMALLKHVRKGGMVALVHDVFDGDGTPISFLGKPAPTALSAAEIALKTNAVLLPFFGIRHADGYGFDAIIETPIAHSTALEMMQEATRRLEARIEADPGQWMWSHRRWKPKRQAKRQRKRAAATMAP